MNNIIVLRKNFRQDFNKLKLKIKKTTDEDKKTTMIKDFFYVYDDLFLSSPVHCTEFNDYLDIINW